jgi:hypothetical protein
MPSPESITPPTREQIRNLLSFLPQIEHPAESFSTFDPDTSIFDPYIYSPLVNRFTNALYDNSFCQPFDWPAWHDQAAAFIQNPVKLNQADLETLVRLFTIITRKERFCSGTIAGFLDDGLILAMLKRLKTIEQTKS